MRKTSYIKLCSIFLIFNNSISLTPFENVNLYNEIINY